MHTFPRQLLHPRHWSSWTVILLLRIVALLPFRAKLIAGQLFGHIGYHLIARRRHIVETNVRLCFPDHDAAEQRKLVRKIFVANGIGFFEIAWSWWANDSDIARRYRVEGMGYLDKAKAQGRGILLIGAHFTHIDLCGTMANQVVPMDVVYRKNNNPVFEHIITKGRQRVFNHVLERSNMRAIVKNLRAGNTVWYSPDQDFGGRQAVFAPFFGINAATLVSTSRLVKMGQATPIGFFHYRDPVTQQYRIVFKEVTEDFPSGDDVRDAILINRMLEKAIAEQPDQYMCVHRRFKTRPDGEPSLY